MIYVVFIVSSFLLVLAATKLAEFADAIALRTGLGRLFIGSLLLAAGTSLPEFLTTISSLQNGVPDLAAGNIFGSNLLNVALLGFLDLAYWRTRFLQRVANRHILICALCFLLTSLTVFFVQANIPLRIGWVGLDSILVIVVYLIAVYELHRHSQGSGPDEEEIEAAPEIVTCVVAMRLGAYDLAVGNLLGSLNFNLFSLGITDFIYTKGQFLLDIDPIFGLVGVLSLILVGMVTISNIIARRRGRPAHLDGFLITVTYILSIYFVYQRGLGG